MTSAHGELIVQNTATVGTGTVTLGTAVAPYLTAALAGMRDGDTVDYSIVDVTGGNSEGGYGVLGSSQTTLTRNPITSTNSNNAISISGSAVVRIAPMKRTFDGLSGPTVHANFGGL